VVCVDHRKQQSAIVINSFALRKIVVTVTRLLPSAYAYDENPYPALPLTKLAVSGGTRARAIVNRAADDVYLSSTRRIEI